MIALTVSVLNKISWLTLSTCGFIILIYLFIYVPVVSAMHRVGSAGNTNNSSRPRKEKRLTYVLNDADDTKVY